MIKPDLCIVLLSTMYNHIRFLVLTIVVVIEVLFTVELSSNVNIFTELVTEILRILLRQFRNRQKGVDLIISLLAPHLLQGDVNHGDERRRDVPDGGAVDEVPLLGVDLTAACLLSQLSLRHRPGQHDDMSSLKCQDGIVSNIKVSSKVLVLRCTCSTR